MSKNHLFLNDKFDIKQEIHLNRLAADVNEIFEISVLCNFLASGIFLCLFGFILIIAKSTMVIIRFCFTFLGMMVQIYLVCTYGEQLQKKVNSNKVMKDRTQ